MRKLIQKDKNNRVFIKQVETKKFVLKNLIYNENFSKISRWKSFEKLFTLPSNSSMSAINNRCIITGRKNRINKLYSFSRILFLKLVRSNNINGLKKSSW